MPPREVTSGGLIWMSIWIFSTKLTAAGKHYADFPW